MLKKSVNYIIATIIAIIVQTCLTTTTPSAVTWGVVVNGQGGVNGGTTSLGDLGIQEFNCGYRIYLESKGGNVVDGCAIDLYFSRTPPSQDDVDLKRFNKTSIGEAYAKCYILYDQIKEYVPGLMTPIQGHKPQGENLNTWFQTKNKNRPESTNAEVLLGCVYAAAGISDDTISKYIEQFQLGNYRLVVEAIYWIGYVRTYEKLPVATKVEVEVENWVDVEVQVPDPKNPNKTITTIEKQKQIDKVTRTEYPLEWVKLPYTNPLTGDTHNRRHYVNKGQTKDLWVYGTIKEIAAYEKSQANTEQFVKGTGTHMILDGRYGTSQFYGHTNGLMATTLYLSKDNDETNFSEMKTVGAPSNSYNGFQIYNYDEITNPSLGFGTHIIRKEQASEKWATWNATKYGGTKGNSPGVTPKMPPLAGMGDTATTWRDVTVVKYYEEYTTVNGKRKYSTVSGPYETKSICLQIEIQTEPGWTLQEFTQTQADLGT